MLKPTDSIFKVFETEIKKISLKKKVIDIGTSQRFAKEMTYFRDLFKGNYQALGYNPKMIYGQDNCDFNGDILNLPFKNNSVDAVICLEVIEHVTDPFKAVSEIYRVTKTKGTVILTAPFLLSYHGKDKSLKKFSHSNYPDFWRFTHQGLQLLFKDFTKVKIIPFTSTVEYYTERFFTLFKLDFIYQKLLKNFISTLQKKSCGNATYRHLVVAEK